jgi:glycosyltransferase involved in cell wall biosynthesis
MAGRPKSDYRVLYLNSTLRSGGIASEPRLRDVTSRRRISLAAFARAQIVDPLEQIRRCNAEGAVIWMSTGLPDLDQLKFAGDVLSQKGRVWFYWPGESAIECIDREQIRSYTRHHMAAKVWETIRPLARLGYAVVAKVLRSSAPMMDDPVIKNCHAELDRLIAEAKPVPFAGSGRPSRASPLAGVGFYLRTDYWAHLTSGGSYTHTCYLAKSLARTVQHLICLTPSQYDLLSVFGLNEVVLPSPGIYRGEKDFISSNSHYYSLLRRAIENVRPVFIYERLCLGNYSAAQLSREFGIPYIVEYNGSEIEMSRRFGGHQFQYEDLLVKAEEAAFRQATIISVVSEPLKDDLVGRGIPSSKILVNPNGVDPEEYSPPSESEKNKLRAELGWNDSHRVVGFTGTFGGWHGIEVLAEAIPQICRRVPNVRFLLIGDGNYKQMVDSSVRQNGVEEYVFSSGRVPQQEGARLLRACDIYVSPHSKVMTGGKFFGSPTKLFEYMAMAGGIVASDLDQIGEILSPALRSCDLNGSALTVTGERAVLCPPGDVTEFVKAVEYLANHPEVASRLGQNARRSAVARYTWDCHIDRLWEFVHRASGGPSSMLSLSASSEPKVYARQLQRLLDPGTMLPSSSSASERVKSWISGVRLRHHISGKVLLIDGAEGPDTDFSQHDWQDAELTWLKPPKRGLPFTDRSFDFVFCPDISVHADPQESVGEIWRVLQPGGEVFVLAYAEDSYYHWIMQFLRMGMINGLLSQFSLSEVISRDTEVAGANGKFQARPYTKDTLRRLFSSFDDVRIAQMQLTGPTLPPLPRWMAPKLLDRAIGRDLVLRARKHSVCYAAR